MITLIDYGAGNLRSVQNSLKALGASFQVTSAPSCVAAAESIILPGVGHFAHLMSALDSLGLREPLCARLRAGTPFLGICLGMQALYEASEEAPGSLGLGFLPGMVVRLPSEARVPQIGWNRLDVREGSRLLDGCEGAYVYFANSFAVPICDSAAASFSYGGEFAATVEQGNLFGTQFHPEKSGDVGLRMLRNFIAVAEASAGGAGAWEKKDADTPSPVRQGSPTLPALKREREGREGQVPACPASANVPKAIHAIDPAPGLGGLAKRIIPCLDVLDGRVVKGINFVGLRDAGDPIELAARYNDEGADEIVFLDISATIEGRGAMIDVVRRTAERVFVPLTVGGGIRSVDDARALLRAGADKVSVNSAALQRPELISELSQEFGAQATVLAIDAARDGDGWKAFGRSGSTATGRDAIQWAKEGVALGAGEILLTSIDADGVKAGFDCDLTRAISRATSVPVVASGGGGTIQHFMEVLTKGRADAALAASIFHYRETSIREIKQALEGARVAVRP